MTAIPASTVNANASITIATEPDVTEAVRRARLIAADLGFAAVQAHYIATAASELAANLLIHAGGGVLNIHTSAGRPGLELVAVDHGPGIADLGKAMQDGYSTAGGLGCGLPGVQRLMDELRIDSRPGEGTIVRACKWI